MRVYPNTGVEYLSEIKSKNWRLASIENERQEYEARCYNISSPNLEQERVSGGNVIHGLETKVERMAEYAALIEEEYSTLLADTIEARKMLSQMKDKDLALFLKEYYVLNHSFNQISRILHCGKTTVRENVRKGEREFNALYEGRHFDMQNS